MRLALHVLAAALLAGCASRPTGDGHVPATYRTGMSRDEAHELLAQASRMTSVARPAAGWPPADESAQQASLAAFQYEKAHPGARVASCEVYRVGRGTSAPLVAGGVWWDYLFFDDQDRLLGYHRRFLD